MLQAFQMLMQQTILVLARIQSLHWDKVAAKIDYLFDIYHFLCLEMHKMAQHQNLSLLSQPSQSTFSLQFSFSFPGTQFSQSTLSLFLLFSFSIHTTAHPSRGSKLKKWLSQFDYSDLAERIFHSIELLLRILVLQETVNLLKK